MDNKKWHCENEQLGNPKCNSQCAECVDLSCERLVKLMGNKEHTESDIKWALNEIKKHENKS